MADTIKMGFIGPLTGAAAVYGVSCAQGAQIAVEEINALGGLQIELNVQDDEHDAEKSVNAYNLLWDWGAQMICGTVTTAPARPWAPKPSTTACSCSPPPPLPPTSPRARTTCTRYALPTPRERASTQFIFDEALGARSRDLQQRGCLLHLASTRRLVAKGRIGLEVVSATTFTDETTDFSVRLTDARTAPTWSSCPSTTPPLP